MYLCPISNGMRFEVPQFIEVEDKIFGPLTLKQFIYVAGGAGAVAILYIFLPFFIFLLLAPLVGAFAVGLAFIPVNKRPMSIFLESMVRYFGSSRLYLWKKGARTPIPTKKEGAASKLYTPPSAQNTIASLSRDLELHTFKEKR